MSAPISNRPLQRNGARERVSRWANAHMKWLFAAPAMIFIAALIGFPLIWTGYLSLTDAQGSVRSPFHWIGLGNYVSVLTDTARFWPAVARTIIFTAFALAGELAAGMGVALLLWRPFKRQKWVRVAVLLPFVATPVAVAFMWQLIFDPNVGYANYLLGWIGIPPQSWFSSPSTALATVIFVDIWEFTPMITIILLAGLTALPDAPDEAARIDGANAWQRFRYVTLPLLRPVILTAIILRAIDALKTFDLLYATEGPGGGSFHQLETLNIYAYTLTFKFDAYGQASAVLMLFLALILMVLALLTLRRNQVRSA